jgi:hypothetical protein
MTKCNLKTGLVGLTAIALGTLAIVSTGQAGTPLPLPLKPFVIAGTPAATPIAIQARPPLQPAVVAATPVISGRRQAGLDQSCPAVQTGYRGAPRRGHIRDLPVPVQRRERNQR